MPDLFGKTALITGASSGIGAAFAPFLASKGIKVILVARREDRLEHLAEGIGKAGGWVRILPADLAEEAGRLELFEAASKIGTVDILINNAGFGWYGFFHKMPWDLARQMAAVNIEAVAHLTSLFIPQMVARGSGHVINIGSVAGSFPNQGIAMYAASKAFIDAFTTSLYRELHGSGVTASVMRLGPVKSEFYDLARNLENGASIPAEKLAIGVEQVNRALWRLLRHPRRVMYVPAWISIIKFAEPLLGGIADQLGPLLLKRL